MSDPAPSRRAARKAAVNQRARRSAERGSPRDEEAGDVESGDGGASVWRAATIEEHHGRMKENKGNYSAIAQHEDSENIKGHDRAESLRPWARQNAAIMLSYFSIGVALTLLKD